MTLIGIWLTEPDRAFAWCDTQIFRIDGNSLTPSGHSQKMAVNDDACAVVVTMGCKLMSDIAAEVTARCIMFDLLVDALPVQARRDWHPLEDIPSARALAAGYSHTLRRIVGFEFASGDGFVPRRVLTMAAFPYCREAESLFPREPADLLGIAQIQTLEIQKLAPKAGHSELIVADIRRGAISVHRLSGAEGMLQRPRVSFADA